jgi:hypothetical protein
MGIIQAGLTIMAMLSTVGNHASPLQWIVIAILSIPAALVGGIIYKGRAPSDGGHSSGAQRSFRNETNDVPG